MAYDWRTHGDFKAYYDTLEHRNYWTLGYFGGRNLPIHRPSFRVADRPDFAPELEKLARDFAEECGVSYESVVLCEILESRRHKYFKYLTSDTPDQKPAERSRPENHMPKLPLNPKLRNMGVLEWLTD